MQIIMAAPVYYSVMIVVE